MEFIEDIKKEEFDKFIKNNKKSHFLQSYAWGEFCQKSKGFKAYYVGMKDGKKLVAATLLLQKKLYLGYSYFYAPRGYILDFDNQEILEEFTNLIKKFAKEKKAIFVKIDPDIKRHDIDLDGNIMNEGNNNYALIENLKKLGYKHLGFNQNFERSQPRYTFRLNLTPSIEEITNHFHNSTKKIMKKGNPFELEILRDEDANIDEFYLTMKETAKRENIACFSKEYYENFYKVLHKYNQSNLYEVRVDIKKLKDIYHKQIKELENNSKTIKSENKLQEYKNQIQKIEKELSRLDDIKEDKIVLSSIITAKYGNKVWTIHGGNNSVLRELNANYLIYYEIIKDAKKEGYEYIDFFGTTGNPAPNNPVYGIHLFKKRLNGEYMEFIGEFDLVINKFLYTVFNGLIPTYRKLVKFIQRKKA